MPIPTFTENIPIGTQSLGNTVVAINNNFGNYNGLVGVNHGPPNATNQGKHLFVEMPVQGSAPTTLSGEGGLFTQTVSGNSELFYQRDGVATNYRMSGGLFSASGYAYIGTGILMQWAQVAATSGGVAVTFPIPFPTNVFSVVLGPLAGSPSSSTVATISSNPTLSGFAIKTSGASFGVYYIAIGN